MRALAVVAALVTTCLAQPAWAKPAKTALGPRRSTPIALSENGRILVNVNPDDGSVTSFKVGISGLTGARRIPVGGDPRSVAIGNDNRTAWVALAKDGAVAVVDLKKHKTKKKTIAAMTSEGWPTWTITRDAGKEQTKTLADILKHVRNAVAHGRLTFTSDSRRMQEVTIIVEDKEKREDPEPY